MNLLILIAPMLVSGIVTFIMLALLQWAWETIEEWLDRKSNKY